MCYGWLALSPQDIEKILAVPELDYIGQGLRSVKDLGPHAILMEFFDNAARVSIDNVTEQIADAGMKALYDIHRSYVSHGDVHERNILVLPDGRVVWIDFDRSAAPKNLPTMSRLRLLYEAAEGWGLFYQDLVRFNHIGMPIMFTKTVLLFSSLTSVLDFVHG